MEGIWLSFYPDAKIGVIGPNGTDKSALLKIMTGLDKDFVGESWPTEGVKIGYLDQEFSAPDFRKRPRGHNSLMS